MDFPNTNERPIPINMNQELTLIPDYHYRPANNFNMQDAGITNLTLIGNLNRMIDSLNSLNKELILKTEAIINSIKKNHIEVFNSIKRVIENYKKLLNRNEIPSLIYKQESIFEKTEKSLKQLKSSSIFFEIRSFYSQILSCLEIDLSEQKSRVKKDFLESHNGGFVCMDISADKDILLTGSEESTLRVWDLTSMKQKACLFGHSAQVQCLSLSNDTYSALSGSLDKTVILWSLTNNRLETIFKGHQGAVYCVDFYNNENCIISGSVAKEIILWSISSKNILKIIRTSDIITSWVKIKDHEIITATNGNLEKWELVSIPFICKKSIQAHEKTIWTVAVAQKKRILITGSQDTTIKVWDKQKFSIISHLRGHDAPVKSVALTSDDKQIVSGGEDKKILLWDLQHSFVIHKINLHEEVIYSLKIINGIIFSASRDSRIGILTIPSMAFQSFLSTQPFFSGSETIKDSLIAYGSSKKVIICDMLKSFQKIFLEGHEGQVYATCFSSQNKFLISASEGFKNNLIYWDFNKNFTKFVLKGHKCSVICVDVATNDSIAISGDVDGKIFIWNLKMLRSEAILSEHQGSVNSVKISNNQIFAASGGADLRVIVWNIGSKDINAILKAHTQPVWKVLFTIDEINLVSGNSFEGIFIWKLKPLNLEPEYQILEKSNSWLNKNSFIKAEFMEFLN